MVDFVLFGQTDNFFGVLFKDIDFRTDIHFAVFPADAQNGVRVVIAEVLAIIEGVEVVFSGLEVVDFEVCQDQAAQFAPFAQAIDAITFWVFFAASFHTAKIGWVYEPVCLIC